MKHPFQRLLPARQQQWFCLFSVLSVVFMIVLAVQGAPLRNVVAPRGILDLQLAFQCDRAQSIIDSWAALPRTAWYQVVIDFGFLVAYPLAISLGCALISQLRQGAISKIAVACSWLVLPSGPLDLVEDVASLQMLSHGATQELASIVSWCATFKFLCALPCFGFLVIVGIGTWLRQRRTLSTTKVN